MSSLFQKIWNIIFVIGSLITTRFFLFVFTIFRRAMRALHFRPRTWDFAQEPHLLYLHPRHLTPLTGDSVLATKPPTNCILLPVSLSALTAAVSLR